MMQSLSCAPVLRAAPVVLARPRISAASAPPRARHFRVCSAAGAFSNPLQPGETEAQAMARRAKESERVAERTKRVTSKAELDACLSLAAETNSLVILSVESEDECFLGGNPTGATQSWAQPDSKDARMEACRALRDSLQRVARDCENVSFVVLEGDADAAARALSAELGVSAFPTVQYWRAGRLLWQHAGALGGSEALGEGVLFYAGAAGGGAKASDYIEELANASDLESFVTACAAAQEGVRGVTLEVPCEKQLAIVDVSLGKDSPGCVHIYPVVLALAKNTAGAVRWSRLLGDASPAAAEVMAELNVTKVPTFVFFADGKEVGRYAGADRGALMATVLEEQSKLGFQLPSAPVRKRISIAEAKAIAAEAKARDKAAGRKSGW